MSRSGVPRLGAAADRVVAGCLDYREKPSAQIRKVTCDGGSCLATEATWCRQQNLRQSRSWPFLNLGPPTSLKLLCPIPKCCFAVLKSSEAKKDPSHPAMDLGQATFQRSRDPVHTLAQTQGSDRGALTPTWLSPAQCPPLTAGKRPALCTAPDVCLSFIFHTKWL